MGAPSSPEHRAPVSHHSASVQASPEWLPFRGPEPARCILGSSACCPQCQLPEEPVTLGAPGAFPGHRHLLSELLPQQL